MTAQQDRRVAGAQPQINPSQPYVQDKAAILSSLDPSKVAEILALMSPADAVTLLAAMNDTSMTVVIDALTPEERAKMMKVRQLGVLGVVERLEVPGFEAPSRQMCQVRNKGAHLSAFVCSIAAPSISISLLSYPPFFTPSCSPSCPPIRLPPAP